MVIDERRLPFGAIVCASTRGQARMDYTYKMPNKTIVNTTMYMCVSKYSARNYGDAMGKLSHYYGV